MKGQIKTGFLVGDGAAQNVSLGWIPDYVVVSNVTDGDKITTAWLSNWVVPFSSGGTTEIVAGDVITGATTTGASARVKEVLLYSGTWAGGDAAGFFVVDEMVGTFTSENVYVSSDTTSGTNDATVTANVVHSVSIDTEVASETGNAAISRYTGSTSAAAGFTIGSTISEEAKLLRYVAMRSDQ